MSADVLVYRGPERRKQASVTEDQLDSLVEKVAQRAAELAAEKAAEKAAVKAAEMVKADFYKTIGKSVVDKALWLIGVVFVAGYFYAKEKGLVK